MERQIFISEFTLHFNLRKPKSDKPTAIFAVVYINGRQLKFPTGVKVYPHQWNKRTQKAYVSVQLTELDNANNAMCNGVLQQYRTQFEEFRNDICSDLAKLDRIKQLLVIYMSKANPTKKADKQVNPLMWLRLHLADIEPYRTAFNQFTKWLDTNKITITQWSDLTLPVVERYNQYARQRYSASRYTTLMAVIKRPLQLAYKDKSVTFNDLELIEFLKDCKKTAKVKDDGRVALSAEQLDIIYNLPNLQCDLAVIRDMFVFQCLTSLRHSNVTGADFTAHKGKRQFSVVQVKEKGSFNQIVSLELDSRIEVILNRYNWCFPKISNAAYNKGIEEIVKLTPFGNDTAQIKTKQADGSVKVTALPLYKAIRSHNGRRTFITEMRSNPNVMDRDLVRFTGHAQVSQLETYDKGTADNAVRNVINALHGTHITSVQTHGHGQLGYIFELYDHIAMLLRAHAYNECEILERTQTFVQSKGYKLGTPQYYSDIAQWLKTYENTIPETYGSVRNDIDRIIFKLITGMDWN